VVGVLGFLVDPDSRLPKRSPEFLKIHTWFMPPREQTVSQHLCRLSPRC
jgi:hypothetical protein